MGRQRCDGCGRPQKVCLCSVLPASPFSTRTHLLILQHPHEARHKLSTLPILSRCIASLQVIQGRAFRPGLSPLLDLFSNNPNNSPYHALLLFPSQSAQPISSWFHHHVSSVCSSCQHHHDNQVPDQNPVIDTPHILLIAIDATWQHANEMLKASAPFLNKFCVPVCLPYNDGEEGLCIGNSDLILRKEPFKGCMTTMEAVASCLRVLEPNGEDIYLKILSVLRAMVQNQASNITAHKVRIQRSTRTDDVKSIPSNTS